MSRNGSATEDARLRAARQDGLLLCPEGAAMLAACEQSLASGLFGRDERVVLFNVGSVTLGGWRRKRRRT